MYIGLPKTLQDKFKIKPAEKPNEIDSFNCWHTKKFVFKRKTGLIIMNDEVRFSVVLFNIRKKEMENLLPLFKKQLKVNLSLLEISEDKIINYLSNIGDISFIKNTNRSIIGQLNDSAFALEAYLEEIDEIGTETLNILNDNLNHIPMIPLQKKGYNPFPNKAILEVINKKY